MTGTVRGAGAWLYCARCGQAGITSGHGPCPVCAIAHWLPDHGLIEQIGHPETALVRSLAELRGQQSAAKATARILADPYAPDGSPVSLARSVLYTWPADDPPLHVCGTNLLAMATVTQPLRALLGGVTLPVGPGAVTLGFGQAGRQADQRLSPVDTGALIVSLGQVAYFGRAQRWSIPARDLLGFQPQQIAPQVVRLVLHTTAAIQPHALDVLHDGHSPSAAFYLEWAQAHAHHRVTDFEDLLETRLAALRAANADARARYAASSPVYR